MARSRPFAFNTGNTINGTIQIGDIAIGIDSMDYSSDIGGVKWWMGPDEELGYVICLPDPNSRRPLKFGLRTGLGFLRTSGFSDESFLNIVNYIAREQGHSTFNTISEAEAWLGEIGYPTTYNTNWDDITPTPTKSPAATPSRTPSVSISRTPSVTPSISFSRTPTRTPSISVTRSVSITPSITPSKTATPGVSQTPSVSISRTPSITPTISRGGGFWATREPSALSLTTVSESRIDATWTDGAEAGDGLRVYYSTDNVTFIEHGTANFGDEAYSLTSLPEARHIYVKVVAYSGTNESTGDTADDYTAMKILLTSTGTGAGVSTLRLWFDTTPVTCTLSGAGRFYSDSGGTADESTSYEFPAGSLQARYLKVPSSTSNLLIFHKGNMLGWGSYYTDGWASSNNAARAAVSTEDFARDMVYFRCTGSNTISGALSDLPSGLTSFYCTGSNTISGALSDLPSDLTYFRCEGSNTISGALSDLPSDLTYFRCEGSNTISGALSDLPSDLTYFICTGSNTISGALSDLPSDLTYFDCTGSNTISDYTAPHTWSNSINYIKLIQAVGSGLDETEVDNLLIDLASATWAGGNRRVELPTPNAPRSSASDAAVATLLGKSVTVVTAVSQTPSVSISRTPSITPSISISKTPSISLTRSPATSVSGTPSVSPTRTPTVTPTSGATPQNIIADHTSVDDFENIPPYYINEVKKMLFNIPGESHSFGYTDGLQRLEDLSGSTYNVNVSNGATAPQSYTDQYLRVNRVTWGDISNPTGWRDSYGEEDWYSTDAATGRTWAGIAYCLSNGYSINAMGFGWCWDDAEQAAQMVRYNSATQYYNDLCQLSGFTNTKIFFTTGPVDGWGNTEVGYRKYQAYEAIRNFVRQDSSRVLFDYADILCYDNDGTGPNTASWNGNVFPVITSNNLGDGSIAHIGPVGTLRLGKAAWWLMARLAGWDGNPVGTTPTVTPSRTPTPTPTPGFNTLGLHGAVTWLDSTHISVTYDWSNPDQLLDWEGLGGSTLSIVNNRVQITDNNVTDINAMRWIQPIAVSGITAQQVSNTGNHLNFYTNLDSSWSGTPFNAHPSASIILADTTACANINGSFDSIESCLSPGTTPYNYVLRVTTSYISIRSSQDNVTHQHNATITPSTSGRVALGAYEFVSNWGQITIMGEVSVTNPTPSIGVSPTRTLSITPTITTSITPTVTPYLTPTPTPVHPNLGLHGLVSWTGDTYISVTYDWSTDDQLTDFTTTSGTYFGRFDSSRVIISGGTSSIWGIIWKKQIKLDQLVANNVRSQHSTDPHINFYSDLDATWFGGSWAPNPGCGAVWRNYGSVIVFNGSDITGGSPSGTPVSGVSNNYTFTVTDARIESREQNNSSVVYRNVSTVDTRSTNGLVALGAYQSNTIWGSLTFYGTINQWVTLTSGDLVYRKGVRGGLYVIDKSTDGGSTWELDLVNIQLDETNIIKDVDNNPEGYRQVIRNNTYCIDHELTTTGFAGVENTDWENIYTLT